MSSILMMYFARASLYSNLFEERPSSVFFSILPCLGDTCSKQSRAAGYRVIRHALVDRERVSCLGDALDWYIVKCVIPLNMQHGQTGFPGLYSVIISMQSRKNKWPS
jgi:Rapamycin-insensitive companion of mTOR, N-term